MKRLTANRKELAIQLHIKGLSNAHIARQMNHSRTTISNLVNDWKKGRFIAPKKRKEHKRKLSAQQVYNVLSYFVRNPFDTIDQCIKSLRLPVKKDTIRRVLKKNGIGSYVACRKLFLSIQNQIKRLRFAMKYQHWTGEDWLKVTFLDEKTIQTYSNGRVLVKRKLKERYCPDKIITSEKQNSRNKVNLVGIVSHDGPNMLYTVSNNLNGNEFEQLIRLKVANIIKNTKLLMDNASIHRKGLNYLKRSGIAIFNFPPKSPDMNLIENVWAMLQKKINLKLRNRNISTKLQLIKIVEESWIEIPTDFIVNCVLSMPNRLKEVIRMKGAPTRY